MAGFFGLFGSKKAQVTATWVAPAVGTVLHAESAVPDDLPPAVAPSYGQCQGKVLDSGRAEVAQLDDSWDYYEIRGVPGRPPSAVRVRNPDGKPTAVLAELQPGSPVRLSHEQPLRFSPDQDKWLVYGVLGVACLPAARLLMAVSHTVQKDQTDLYVHDLAQGTTVEVANNLQPEDHKLAQGRVEMFSVLVGAPNAALVLYHTDRAWKSGASYNQFDHVMLFSAAHPQGLEVLRIGIDDGNVQAWAMQGHKLWLQTLDSRVSAKPVRKTWSLDLARLL